MTQVPLLDLSALHAELGDELASAALRVLGSERVLLGPELAAFEQAWAAQVGAAHGVGVGNGLDALALGLRAFDVGPGDEVLVPAHTFIATWLAVVHVGATPVPVDVSDRTGLWDADAVGAAVGPRTRAMIPVHLYGHPVDLDPLLAIARRHGLVVLDDAAQAHGARYRGRPVGGLCDATTWSFYPGKNLGAVGDGGAVTTSDPAVADRLRSLRNYGSTEKYVHDEIGWNSRLDELQAALLSVKLRRLDEHNARRAVVAERYAHALGDCGLTLPGTAPWARHAWHQYVVRTPHRDALHDHLAALGVQTVIHYPVPPHHQGAFATLLTHGELPVAEALAREVLSLPMGPHLSEQEQVHVIDSIRSFRP
ncbi:erythromycin biosynthesis sensory transduction protein eryC1 [Modestobacter sp. I12A-02628]|uniref:DegT/DnrJ/EryC1/StrS family aminotransferase n=1 Tax=Goekera deserti TaxID=2497753 RepID=A0A7K3WCY9_9ACTN|nr:erythromycin biosynthesis sensory transduction protein eryC1 [Goekera deserti]NDI49013.1 erythromycin biosynthesis sensory transduction protein eryC1 [Goekera deserti]NEL54196.1 DegT/DnrJ/EryC1/StrS family aminotransferase [Goekera deserti]